MVVTLASAPVDARLSLMSGRITRAALLVLDFLAANTLAPRSVAKHMSTGRRGEEDVYFHLRRLGYVVVARNYRSPRRPGQIDLIAWHKDILCFIEVKTRSSHDVKPAQAAVDRYKWRELKATAREYLRAFPPDLQWRFDLVTVYYEPRSSQPQFQIFQNALPSP